MTASSTSERLAALGVLAVLVLACGERDRFGGEEDPILSGADAGGVEASEEKGCAKTEVKVEKVPVDVIMSVDQSSSMDDDIRNVKNNINKLADFLDETGLDYRVVMIGETGNEGTQICVPPPLGGSHCKSNGTKFRAVARHIESNDTLSVILDTLDAEDGVEAWKDFLRPDAFKVFVPLTDDDSFLSAAAFDAELLGVHGAFFGAPASRRYVFYPLTGAAAYPSEDVCASAVPSNGAVYLDLAKLTDGKWFSICLPSFAPVFREMGKLAADVVACELPIPKPPDGEVLDPERVNVKIVGSGGEMKEIFQDPNEPCDSGADGWQYNDDKSKVLLCGPTCASVRADNGATVSVQFGCKTRVTVR